MFVQNDSTRTETGSVTRQLSPVFFNREEAEGQVVLQLTRGEAGFEILLLYFDVTLFPSTEMKQLN